MGTIPNQGGFRRMKATISELDRHITLHWLQKGILSPVEALERLDGYSVPKSTQTSRLAILNGLRRQIYLVETGRL